jgi:hypothetical protein
MEAPMGTELHLEVAEEGSDPGRLEELSLRLRQELLSLDVESVRPYGTGDAPEGTRGDIAMIAGALAVTLQPTVALLTAMVGVVRDWAGRGRHAVRVEIGGDVLELTAATDEVQRRLVDDWIARHAVT